MPLEEGKSAKGGSSLEPKLTKEQIEIIELKAKLEAAVSTPVVQQAQGGVSAEFLEKLVEKINTSNKVDPYADKAIGDTGYVDVADIDEEDRLEEGHTFWCHQAGFVIVDDTKSGKAVRTPLNTVIIFKYAYETRKGTGKDMELYVLSSYVSHSKKEVEWLKKSTYFNKLIFDDVKVGSTKQARKAAKINQYVSAARKMDRRSFHDVCASYDIPMNKDPEVMALTLASIYADKAILEEDRSSTRRAKEAAIEKDLIEQVNQS